jgi:glycerol-3-phosphate dehydrogenase (NAD(P)+)
MSTDETYATTCAVIGAGAWGTTLALLLGGQGHEVRLWARRPELVRQMRETGENDRYLSGFSLPETVTAHHDLETTLEHVGAVIIAVPSVGLRTVVRQMAAHISAPAMVISATKGLERGSGKRMSQVLAEELPQIHSNSLLALSGPNLSREIAGGLPAVSVVAGCNSEVAHRAQRLLSTALFRVYTNCDIIGVELGGALKNVIAVGAGVSDGLGYGDNAKASLLTRGLAEMCRLSRALGAMPETLWGISGVGDLITTCASKLSRNWTLGYRVGRGQPVAEVIDSMYDVAEGYYTTHAACQIAKEVAVDAPIAQAVAEILYEGKAAGEVARRLMTRPKRNEQEDWHCTYLSS